MKQVHTHTVLNYKSTEFTTLHHLMTIREALVLLGKYNKTELPIVDEGRFIGVVRLGECIEALNHLGLSLEDEIYHVMQHPTTVVRETALMENITTFPVYITEKVSDRLVGIIEEKEMLSYIEVLQEELLEEREKAVWFELCFETAYEGLAVVDEKGVIKIFNETYSRFVGVSKEDAIGKKADKVIENTRLPVVLKTGIPERSQAHRLQGQDLVVHRLPIWKDGHLIGAVGMLVYEGVSEIYQVIERMEELEKGHLDRKRFMNRKKGMREKFRFEDILGESYVISETKKIARKASHSKATVLITGESGVGKEQFARAMHDNGMTSDGNFISVNCAAIPENLLESELFGYAEGAFTGANTNGKPGKFELAHGGTLFLDEIGDMPLAMQAKILRVIQERRVERVGGNTSIPVNFRLITATNKDLKQLIHEGLFREDLYYRLFVIPLHIPPLRERKQDIPIIIAHKIKELAKLYDTKEKTMDQQILQQMYKHDWPGNVRELLNVVERLFVLVDSDHIRMHDIPTPLFIDKRKSISLLEKQSERDEVLSLALKKEKDEIRLALKQAMGNKTEAAKLLGISRATLYNKISRHALEQ